MIQVAALSIVAVTIGLALKRPRFGSWRIEHGVAGALGAALTLALGVGPPQLLLVAARLLAAPILTIVGLMVMSQVAEDAGLFDRLGQALARRARGSGLRLFVYVFGVGALVGSFFTNDAAVLILTPIVFAVVERIAGPDWQPRHKLPFYFAVLYVANLVGALVIANPINLVVASLLEISFLEFARFMALPAAASMLVSFVGLWFYFRREIPRQFAEPPAAASLTRQQRWLQLGCVATVGVVLLGFFTESVTGVPVYSMALAGAAILLILRRLCGSERSTPVLAAVDWEVLIFMAGMFVVGLGLRNVGVTHLLGTLISESSGGVPGLMRWVSGLLAAVSSALINNHPTADLMAFTIQDFDLPVSEKKGLAFAALIGGDLGPKMLPIGSLAALIWFRLLRARGVEVPYALYVKIGIPVTLLALAASLLVLELQIGATP